MNILLKSLHADFVSKWPGWSVGSGRVGLDRVGTEWCLPAFYLFLRLLVSSLDWLLLPSFLPPFLPSCYFYFNVHNFRRQLFLFFNLPSFSLSKLNREADSDTVKSSNKLTDRLIGKRGGPWIKNSEKMNPISPFPFFCLQVSSDSHTTHYVILLRYVCMFVAALLPYHNTTSHHTTPHHTTSFLHNDGLLKPSLHRMNQVHTMHSLPFPPPPSSSPPLFYTPLSNTGYTVMRPSLLLKYLLLHFSKHVRTCSIDFWFLHNNTISVYTVSDKLRSH